CLRNQTLITTFEKLPKFSGKSKQNVSNWLQEIQQTINIFKLTDSEKLLYISLYLGVAKDWFFDCADSFLTWASFLEKFIKIFKLRGNADNFDPLCISQDYSNKYKISLNENDQQQLLMMNNTSRIKLSSLHTTIHLNKNDKTLIKPKSNMLGDDLHDQHFSQHEQNRFAVHPIADKQNITTFTNIITQDTNVKTKEKPLGYKDEYETSNIQTPQVNLVPINDASFNVSSLENLLLDDINVLSNGLDVFQNVGITTYNSIIATNSVFIEIQYSLNMHNESIITEIRRHANLKTTAQIILLKITRAFDKTFKYISNNQIITSIDHFQEEGYSQCHIYSYPYKWKIYNNITNNFRGGLFTSVTQVELHDEHPFEYEFFPQTAQSFPFMKELTIKNRKAQNTKQFVKSNNNHQIFSIIEYPNLTRLDLTNTHDDYVELCLFDTNMSLPNNLHRCVDYQSLERVTYYFTRYITRNHFAKLATLYIYPVDQINEHIKNYFPHDSIRRSLDFVLS
ncbi:unnamed protein product, partial [Rotaria sp. Silwood1]